METAPRVGPVDESQETVNPSSTPNAARLENNLELVNVNGCQVQLTTSKGQGIRLFDVFLLGPWLVWLGARPRAELGGLERAALVAVGAGTIVFNGRNYLRNARRAQLLLRAPGARRGHQVAHENLDELGRTSSVDPPANCSQLPV